MSCITVVADDKIPFLRGVLEPFVRQVSYLAGGKITRADLQDVDVLIVRTRTRCDAALLAGTPVKLVFTATIGTDHLDLAALDRLHIAWSNAPGCNADGVAQYLESALLHLGARHQRQLRGRTLGVVGCGEVGSRVAALGKRLGMNVLINDPPLAMRTGRSDLVPLARLLAEADFVTLHTPLTAAGDFPTLRLFDRARIAALKPGAFLINTSRGEVCDGAALKLALERRELAGAVLDVWENEPEIDHELLNRLDYGTPHIAGYSTDGKANGTAAAVRRVAREFGIAPLRDFYPELPPPPSLPVLPPDLPPETARMRTLDVFYNLEDDDRALRSAPERFEELRGNYRVRRELKQV